jgi:hypothetical protein
MKGTRSCGLGLTRVKSKATAGLKGGQDFATQQ